MQPSDEIKSRLDIVDVLREYIPVKAAGVNFQAKCPFHQEKTPSLMISPDKQIWHCFGCGKGGDIFSFMMEMEGLSFVEALRLLAPKAGVTLKREDPKLSSERNRLLDILEYSRRFYHRWLLDNAQAAAARAYLVKRGLNQDTIEEWQVGYSPDSWEAILVALKKNGFRENDIFLAGMIVNRRSGADGSSAAQTTRPGFYDRFRGRIMFPLSDQNGNTVAFSARVSPEKEATEKMGKYINSPQTMVYDKSRILFGLDKAKTAIKKDDLAIIVEGQMDAITAHQHGFKNVVASSGTALTTEQIALLKRYTVNITLAFDMDAAGEMAADRGIREAMAAEMNIKVIELPSGKDPDECIRANPQNFAKAVAAAKPMMQYYFDKVFSPLDLASVEDRRLAAKKTLPMISKLGNRIERDYWLKYLSGKIDVNEVLLRETLAGINIKAKPGAVSANGKPPVPEKERLSRAERLSELLLAMILRFPVLLEYATNHLQIEQFMGEKNQLVYKKLIFYYNNIINQGIDVGGADRFSALGYNDFKAWLLNDDEIGGLSARHAGKGGVLTDNPAANGRAVTSSGTNQLGYLDRLVILGDSEFYDWTTDQAKSEAIKIIVILKKHYLRQRMREIEKLIAESEKGRDESASRDLVSEFKSLGDELRDLAE